MKNIIDFFPIFGELLEFSPFGSGHIHNTYLVDINQGGVVIPYVLQKININVFKSPDKVMQNITMVSEHLKRKMENSNTSDLSRRVLTVIPTKEGQSFFKNPKGECWRAYVYIADSTSYDVIQTFERAFTVARAFGTFLNDLSDLPVGGVNETIKGFHDAINRFEIFKKVLEADSENRAISAKSEINFLTKNKNIFEVFPELLRRGEIKLVVTHNDTKVNNILFDKRTDESLCVVDLDTIMPGILLNDFGDLARTSLSDSQEDEKDLSKVSVQLPIFKALVEGFFSAISTQVSKVEQSHIIHSTKFMPLLIGMRFLTDYLDGDKYFKTKYTEHNLVRAKTQFELVRSIVKVEDQMDKIVRSFF